MSAIKGIFGLFVFLCILLICVSESMAACVPGKFEYRVDPYNECGTQTRTCCSNKEYPEWGAECNNCEESSSSWSLTAKTEDTCPGNDVEGEFECDGTFDGECTDVKAEPNDIDFGSTTTFAFDPPGGYERSYNDCYDYLRARNAKIATSYDFEYQMYKYNYAQATCTDLSSGYMQKYDEPAFYLIANSTMPSAWIDFGQIQRCPPNVDGNALGCMNVCNVPYNDNHGCKQKMQCYTMDSMYTMDNCESWPYHNVVGNSVVFTCDVGSGGTKYKFKLKQCGYKYQKRNVKCCSK